MPIASVIIAAYNKPQSLYCAVLSVLRQTLQDFDLHVIGDGCDESIEHSLQTHHDPRLSWFNLPQHTGNQFAPNNEGIRRSKGEYIAYLSHDDLWMPQHLELLVRALQEERADVAYSITLGVPPDDSAPLLMNTPRRHRASTCLSPSAVVHRRSLFERTGLWQDPRTLSTYTDCDLWKRFFNAGARFVCVPRLLTLKFPASWHKHAREGAPLQEAYVQKMTLDPEFEAKQLAACMMETQSATSGLPFTPLRTLVRDTLREAIRRPFARPKTKRY